MHFEKGLLGPKQIGGDLIDFLAKLAAKYFKVFLAPMEGDDTLSLSGLYFHLESKWSSGGPNLSCEAALQQRFYA